MPVSGGRFGPASVKADSAAGISAMEEPAEAKTGPGEFEAPAAASLTAVAVAATDGWTGSGEFESPAAATLTEVAVVTTAGWSGVGPRSAIDAAVFSIWDALKAPSPAAPNPASATVPLKANLAKLRGVMIRSPLALRFSILDRISRSRNTLPPPAGRRGKPEGRKPWTWAGDSL
jgi:hypothetical protein